ncbi:MAG: F0F1 ATP synthase subunit A [Candidatus Kerfeldbacteria bacterium]|nr:F0F1 ATP synthase subunit A [Candidatus Kerfeldbacteria bacterium]
MSLSISLAAEPIAHLGSFPITNTLLASWIAVAVLLVLAFAIRRRVAAVPSGVQNVSESVIEGALGLMDSVTGDRKMSERFFPLVMTLFLFIVTANWLGLMPLFGTVGIKEVHDGEETIIPLLRTVNSDLNVTFALAAVSVIATQVFGVLIVGGRKYSQRFFNLKNPIFTFVGILELFSEIAKMLSFSFRLFGNVFAGEVLLVVVAGLIPYIVPLPFMFLELFVGAIQAFVFAVLTLGFLRIATVESHE